MPQSQQTCCLTKIPAGEELLSSGRTKPRGKRPALCRSSRETLSAKNPAPPAPFPLAWWPEDSLSLDRLVVRPGGRV